MRRRVGRGEEQGGSEALGHAAGNMVYKAAGGERPPADMGNASTALGSRLVAKDAICCVLPLRRAALLGAQCRGAISSTGREGKCSSKRVERACWLATACKLAVPSAFTET